MRTEAKTSPVRIIVSVLPNLNALAVSARACVDIEAAELSFGSEKVST
ncbi:hypothetical protein FP2506_16214 [Fulvimarina pelagi HTCC2506]|uniref:Uncharacterized protein n=1 Tax=Fulvimarina pelagi HTCC2506 TaxID=314231 RepID=Q0G337_9HYPH|nr:hypothetical protein FP2506_16214 [Fulvimarina pelagi HTCC2506]